MMKKKIYIFVCLLIAFCCCFSISTANQTKVIADQEQGTVFSIVGQASKEVSPDIVKVFVTAESENEDAKKCKDDVFVSMEQIVEKLTELGVGEDSIITQSFFTYPQYDIQTREKTGYLAQLSYSFIVKNMENLEKIFDQVVSDGVSTIRNVCYDISNQNEIYNEVLAMAVENAKEKAKVLTGNETIEVLKISEEGTGFNHRMCKTSFVGENGIVTIGAMVKVYFKK